jgi:hypothetical protein
MKVSDLPDFFDISEKVDAGEKLTAIEKFLYEYDVAGQEENAIFRQDFVDALNQMAVASQRQGDDRLQQLLDWLKGHIDDAVNSAGVMACKTVIEILMTNSNDLHLMTNPKI